MGQFSGKLSKLLNINDDEDDDIYDVCSAQINSFLETPPLSVISYYFLEWGGHGLIPSISQRHLQSGNAVQNNVQNGVNCGKNEQKWQNESIFHFTINCNYTSALISGFWSYWYNLCGNMQKGGQNYMGFKQPISVKWGLVQLPWK